MPDMPAPLLIAAPIAFALAMFVLAAYVERRRARFAVGRWRQSAYALGLGVYCTSWTFYGAVGSAAYDGWSYLPIYLGPILLFLVAPRLLVRIAEAAREEGATSVSDLIGARFGRSRGLAALVTVTAALGVVPYIALQLRSIGQAFALVSGSGHAFSAMLVAALLLALFALLFGTRRFDTAGRNEGLLYATAAESVFKLLALAAVAGLALTLLLGAPGAVRTSAAALGRLFAPERFDAETLVIAGLAMAAVLALPRQFYIGVIEARSPADIYRARWPFIAYLLAMALLVPPIAVAGMALVPSSVPADAYVLALPVAAGVPSLALLAALGGFSAATAMVVVETIALATMISNDLIAPLLLRQARLAAQPDLGGLLLRVRRVSVVVVIALALAWAQAVPADYRLASIGHIAFAAMAQFAPLLLLAAQRRHGDALPAIAALATGLALWLYTLALPPIAPPALLAALAGTPLDPRHLLGIGAMPPLVHGAVWSLGANLAVFALLSARGIGASLPRLPLRQRVGTVHDMAGLIAFAGRFVGQERAASAFGTSAADQPVGAVEARRAERLIAGVVGAPSARALVASALAGERLGHEDVARMLDATGQSLQFSKSLLAATLENIDPGVSVVDDDLRLIAWNTRYIELFDYPPGMVRVGTPVADLIRFNAERGDCGPGEIDAHVRRRLAHLRRGASHSFERTRWDGRVLKTVGGPMPGGGYVMCFTDITAEAQARAALERARAELETRVAERTAALRRLNADLAAATRDKTRFLAAASHDLLQPLHAARLFAGALSRTGPDAPIVARVEQSIGAAEELLRALLDISKLDAGGIVPQIQPVALGPLLQDVAASFRPIAEEAGLALRLGPATGAVLADPALLRSIVQNFLSNAVRYTEAGGVLLGVRPAGTCLRICVIDTGPGIPEDQQTVIFREFERLGTNGTSGVGLGLAIVERSARLIGGTIALRSRIGHGSAFSIALPRADGAVPLPPPPPARTTVPATGRRVLVVDDRVEIQEAARLMLERAGHRVLIAGTAAEAMAKAAQAEMALVDFHLGDGPDGIDLIGQLRTVRAGLRAALVTADTEEATRARAAAAKIALIAKPVQPALLLAWLAEAEEPLAAE